MKAERGFKAQSKKTASQDDFEKAIKAARKHTKSAGLTKKKVADAIKKVRGSK